MRNITLTSSPEYLPFQFCTNHKFHLTGESVILVTSVVNAISAPVAEAGNALVLATIWRTHSLRAPSYMFLCALALTDLCMGILGQPFYVL